LLHGSLPLLIKFKLGGVFGVQESFEVKLEITVDQLRH